VSLRAKIRDIVPEYCYEAIVEPSVVLSKNVAEPPFEAVTYQI
jgi:hypothetical protein